jgi:hypothetical protein
MNTDCHICQVDVTLPAPGTDYPGFALVAGDYYHTVCLREAEHAFERDQEMTRINVAVRPVIDIELPPRETL